MTDRIAKALEKARDSKNVERWVPPARLVCDRATYDAALAVIEASITEEQYGHWTTAFQGILNAWADYVLAQTKD